MNTAKAVSLDPFSYLSSLNNVITSNDSVKSVAASVYSVISTVSMIGMMFTIVITAIQLVSTRGHVLDEVKSGIGHRAIIMIITFALPYLLSTIMSVTTKL